MRTHVMVLGAICAMYCMALPAQVEAKSPRIQEKGHLGLGMGIGALAYGLSGKYYLGPDGAIQANMGTQLTSSRQRNGDMFALGADYLFEFGAFASANDIDLALGVGPGLGVAISTLGYVAFDLNACFSTQILFHELPLDFVVEYRPALRFKSTELYDEPGRLIYTLGSFGIHMRYYLF